MTSVVSAKHDSRPITTVILRVLIHFAPLLCSTTSQLRFSNGADETLSNCFLRMRMARFLKTLSSLFCHNMQWPCYFPPSLDTQSPHTIVVQHHVFDRWSAANQILSHCFCASNGIILPTLLHASFATTHVGSATSCPSLATPRLSLQRQSPRPSVWIHFHLHSACILYLPGLPSTSP